jgi:hypothetical protein
MFCGENATILGTRVEAWADTAVATTGATEGTLQRASQPSIIMHPDSAMPTGPSKTHITRSRNVTIRKRLITCEYRVGPFQSQVLA